MRLSDKISGSLSSNYDKNILSVLNESCEKDLKEEEINHEITWENYEDYSEEEIEEINNILSNLNLTAVKHEGNKEQGYSVAVKDNSSGLVFWLDYIKEGPDIYGEFNQYIFRTDNSNDRIRQAIQTSMYEDGTTLAFEAMESEGLQYLEDKGLIKYTDNNDMIFESCETKLDEDIKDDTASAAKQIALEIQERGIMGFDEIDSMAADILGITVDKLRDEQLDTDIYISLNYEGIDNNMSTGDFYTQEYAEEHPEVLEESEKKELKEEENIPNITWILDEYNVDVATKEELGSDYYYHKLVKNDREAETFNYHSDYWGDEYEYQENMVYFVGVIEGYVDKNVIVDTEDGPITYKVLGVLIDKQYNSVSHAKILVEEVGQPDLEECDKKELKEEQLNETDATPEFLEDLKNLINNHMRVSDIAQITLDNMEGQEYAVITFESGGVKRINITANSNLAVARAILFELA